MQEVVREITGGKGDYGDDTSKELHEEEEEWAVAMDDQSGEVLETAKVRKARKEEIQ